MKENSKKNPLPQSCGCDNRFSIKNYFTYKTKSNLIANDNIHLLPIPKVFLKYELMEY